MAILIIDTQSDSPSDATELLAGGLTLDTQTTVYLTLQSAAVALVGWLEDHREIDAVQEAIDTARRELAQAESDRQASEDITPQQVEDRR